MIEGFLIWKRGARGWICEKWPASYQPPHDAAEVVARYPLNADEYALKIAILEVRYPPPSEALPEKVVKLEGARALAAAQEDA